MSYDLVFVGTLTSKIVQIRDQTPSSPYYRGKFDRDACLVAFLTLRRRYFVGLFQ